MARNVINFDWDIVCICTVGCSFRRLMHSSEILASYHVSAGFHRSRKFIHFIMTLTCNSLQNTMIGLLLPCMHAHLAGLPFSQLHIHFICDQDKKDARLCTNWSHYFGCLLRASWLRQSFSTFRDFIPSMLDRWMLVLNHHLLHDAITVKSFQVDCMSQLNAWHCVIIAATNEASHKSFSILRDLIPQCPHHH